MTSSKPSFKPGDKVRCSRFSGEAAVMEGPNSKNEYRLGLGSLSVWISAEELKPVLGSSDGESQRARKLRKALAEKGVSPAAERIDLHGLTVAQALEALERCIDRALLNGAARIEVIHGIGSGALKKAVLDYVSKSAHVTSSRIDEFNPGTTWLTL